MAVVVSLPQQTYTPRTINATPTIGAGVKKMVLSLTRVSWPVGAVDSIAVTRPDGSAGPQCAFSGGSVFTKDGVTIAPVSGMTLEGINGQDLLVGVYSVVVVISQTITTAVIVESF